MSWTTVQEYLDSPDGYEAHRGGGEIYASKEERLIKEKCLVMPTKARLIINENFMIEFVNPMPCRWHRFWYKLLLGWRWEAIGDEDLGARSPQNGLCS